MNKHTVRERADRWVGGSMELQLEMIGMRNNKIVMLMRGEEKGSHYDIK
jgi:hypothetical protein